MVAEKEAGCISLHASDISSHSSMSEDSQEAIKVSLNQKLARDRQESYAPAVEELTENKPLKQIKRRNTIMKQQIAEEVQSEVQNYLDCGICLNVLEKPVECSTCKRSFCKLCVLDYLNLCKNKAKVFCPNCRNFPFEYVDSHPMLMQALNKLQISCEYQDSGCKEICSYEEIVPHQNICPYMNFICSNFGCDQKILRKDFSQHEKTCEFKV